MNTNAVSQTDVLVVILRETIRRQLVNVTKWKNAEKEAYPNRKEAHNLRDLRRKECGYRRKERVRISLPGATDYLETGGAIP